MPVPEFIVELRSHVGHAQLWLPGVTALVQDDAGRLLLGQRADSGRWALPSGIPDPGEGMAAAIAREVREETGVSVAVEALIAVHTVPPITYPNGDVTAYVDHLFRCRYLDGEAHVADDESLDVGWFAPDELPEPLAKRTPGLLSWAAEHASTGRTYFDPV
ncbi:NUDIX hydrolase [Spongisporangium articulatum]|uniref:NUDIX hydrolase n=1 Tax=Spongisporangium articulatum TaxID=3362603 RepID=A0ABW8AHH5_9ACTN